MCKILFSDMMMGETTTISLVITKDLRERLKQEARQAGLSMSALIRLKVEGISFQPMRAPLTAVRSASAHARASGLRKMAKRETKRARGRT